jgi:hypothetical protein
MTTRHCSQIERRGNSLGRHYSRFRPISRIEHKQYQRLALSLDDENHRRGRESANFG